MHRTQLMLEDWQHEKLRALAESEGKSLSAVVREIVTKHLESRSRRAAKRLERLRGIAEGPADLAREHDHYLYGGE